MGPINMFVDTSAFYALLDADDAYHEKAASAWQEIMASDEDAITTNYVLVETFALVQSRMGMEAVRGFQDEIVPVLRIEFVTPEMHRLGIAALLGASKRSLSLVDCVSFEVMRERGLRSAFTFDAHFREYGFITVP
jgi:uncharacterized protein